MSADVNPYTSADLRSRAVTDVVLPSRLRATVEALERVTKERDEARASWARESEVSAVLRVEIEAQRRAISNGVEANVALRRERDEARSQRDAALASCAEMRAALESGLPFLDDHAKEMADLAAGWPENPDGPGAAATAQRRVDSARKALSSTAGRGWVSPEAFDAALREVADAAALAVLAGSPKNSSRCADGGRCDHYECREDRMFAVTNRRRAIAAIIAAAKAKHGGGR